MNYSDLQFILAGPGHSGSTWLGHVIRATRSIYVTHEINYLTWTKSHYSLDQFFEQTNGATILGEHSNNYFSWDGIPEQLYELNSDLKIIIMVRDPVQKLISNYLHDIRWGILPRYVPLEVALLPNYFERRYVHDFGLRAEHYQVAEIFSGEQGLSIQKPGRYQVARPGARSYPVSRWRPHLCAKIGSNEQSGASVFSANAPSRDIRRTWNCKENMSSNGPHKHCGR